MTQTVADEVKRLVGSVAPSLDIVALHPVAVDGHQNVALYRKR